MTSEPTPIRLRAGKRRLNSPADAIAAGIGMVPGERSLGLVMNQSVRDNILLPSLAGSRAWAGSTARAGDRLVGELMELLDIRPRQPQLRAGALSGGNQQKVILAKWLARRVEVLLLDEPTQGIDVAAKAQIHALIRDFAARGGGALIHSSDLAELSRFATACSRCGRAGSRRRSIARVASTSRACARRSADEDAALVQAFNLAGQVPLITLVALCALTRC